ncbi:hypothetical protein KEM54_003713, partial [Ascosphaera aggregata]
MIDSAPHSTISPKFTGDHANRSDDASSWLERGLVRRMSIKSMQNGFGGQHSNSKSSSSNNYNSNNKNRDYRSNSNNNINNNSSSNIYKSNDYHNQDSGGYGLLSASLSAELAAVRSPSWRSKQQLSQDNRQFADGHIPPNLYLQPVPQYDEDAAPSPAISFKKDFECEIPYGQDFFTLSCSPGSSESTSMAYDFEMRSPTSPRSPCRDISDNYGSKSAVCNPVNIMEPRVRSASKTLQSTLSFDVDGSRQLRHYSTRTGPDSLSENASAQPQQQQQQQQQHQQKQPLQKERSGFLRKLFSGGIRGTPAAVDISAQSSRSIPWYFPGNIASPTRDNMERHGESKSIGKKPSGFFKKRKKLIPTSPVPQTPVMSNCGASVNVDILHTAARQSSTGSGYVYPSQTNSVAQRKYSQGTVISARGSTRDDAGTTSEPSPSEGDPLSLIQTHAQLTPATPVDIPPMTKAENLIAHISERPTDSSTSFEKSMRHYLGGSGSYTNSMTEEMTRMRSLTTGSEGVLNPVTLDT